MKLFLCFQPALHATGVDEESSTAASIGNKDFLPIAFESPQPQ
jgi:hypothetical protein